MSAIVTSDTRPASKRSPEADATRTRATEEVESKNKHRNSFPLEVPSTSSRWSKVFYAASIMKDSSIWLKFDHA